MTDAHPHWFRSALIAAIGLILALISVIWVTMYLRSVGPETISLAYRIDASTAIVFTETNDLMRLKDHVEKLHVLFGIKKNTLNLQSLGEGISYEYALLQASGSGELIEIAEVHGKNQGEHVLESRAGSSSLLPLSKVRLSLGASSFFRDHHEDDRKEETTYLNIAALPKEGIVETAMAPFAELIVLKKQNGSEWVLRKKEASRFTINDVLPDLPKEPSSVISLSSGSPSELFEAFDRMLRKQNPSLQEGILGILRHQLETMTHRSDLKTAIKELAEHGMSFSLLRTPQGSRVLFASKAKNPASLRAWVDAARGTATDGIIRSQTFLHGNTRTDVIASTGAMVVSAENGWNILMPNSGSTLPFTLAFKDSRLLFSTPAGALASDIAYHPETPERGVLRGSISTEWLKQQLMSLGAVNIAATLPSSPEMTLFSVTDQRETVRIRIGGMK